MMTFTRTRQNRRWS